ncbi:Nuclear receptor corepressor 1 [Frankliniella fusca]|uniref:Nuclear receptor corepressor 1 n=1 Tax=Frankliniella fusca TaxID=407009 RepID=A0AAE1HD90_9NEOP|nr:Nuclear receptor corepressor 1 [Frankliniella fusca]
METVQQTVVHLDHGGIQQPSSMAYAQRSSQLHSPLHLPSSPSSPSSCSSLRLLLAVQSRGIVVGLVVLVVVVVGTFPVRDEGLLHHTTLSLRAGGIEQSARGGERKTISPLGGRASLDGHRRLRLAAGLAAVAFPLHVKQVVSAVVAVVIGGVLAPPGSARPQAHPIRLAGVPACIELQSLAKWCARRSTSWSSGTGGSKNCARRIIETIHSAMVVLELGSHRARYNSSFASSCLLVDQPSQPTEGLSFKAQRQIPLSTPQPLPPHSSSVAVPTSVPPPTSGGPGPGGPANYQVRAGAPGPVPGHGPPQQPNSYHLGMPVREPPPGPGPGPGPQGAAATSGPGGALRYLTPYNNTMSFREPPYRLPVPGAQAGSQHGGPGPHGAPHGQHQDGHGGGERVESRPPGAGGPGPGPGLLIAGQPQTVDLGRAPEGTVVRMPHGTVVTLPLRQPLVTSAASDPHPHPRARVVSDQPQYQVFLPPHMNNVVSSAPAPVSIQAPAPAPTKPPQPMDAGPPFKKIRLGDAKQVLEPLRVDTREQPAYTPQVEAISPTLPSEAQTDEAFRIAKDDLLTAIHKMDQEINKGERELNALKRKECDLTRNASKLRNRRHIKKEPDEEITTPKHQSPAQKIYAENRRMAMEAHNALSKLGPDIDYPLYNQPSDTAVYHENKRQYLTFKETLMEHLKKKHAENEERDKYLANTYSRLMQEWVRKVERTEASQKRKAKEAKNREFFEKVFTELRKAREDKERFNRVGARIKSEADMEEIMDGLQEQEMEDKKMRSMAVVPPILLAPSQRRLQFQNNNGLIEDYSSEYKERQLLNVWTASEKEIFREKYLIHPKNFAFIASHLDRKTVSDCVQYYYLSKKSENYKQLLRKSRQRTRSSRNNPGKPNSLANTAGLVDILSSTGVTTRLQREQLQQKREEPQRNQREPPAEPAVDSPKPPTSTSPSVVNNSSTVTNCVGGNTTLVASSQQNDTAAQDVKKGESKVENKKKERRKEDKKKKESEQQIESSDEDISEQDKPVGTQPCILCKQQVDGMSQSRLLPRSQAAQYGLREDEVLPGARVCNPCRCKAVRSRYVHCPLPSCPNAKGRVKRVRPFPPKWADLPAEQRDPIIAEFQIPAGVTKACTACVNRISRRISPSEDHAASGDASSSPSVASSTGGNSLRWTEDETELLKKALREHGTNWQRVSEAVGGTKTHHQCKNFYFNYRKKIGLDALVQEYNKNHLGEERKPALTDEEESGSSTSTSDERENPTAGPQTIDSDTASANSASPSAAAAAAAKAAGAVPGAVPGAASTAAPGTVAPGAGPSATAAPGTAAAPIPGSTPGPGGVPAPGVAAVAATTAVVTEADKVASPAPVVSTATGSASTPSVTPAASPAPNGTTTPIPVAVTMTNATTTTSTSPLSVPTLTTSQVRTASESSDQRTANKEDYDSSATETADEGQGGAEPPQASSAPGPGQSQGPAGAGQANGPASPRVTTVKDLMLSVIEVSLKKTQSAASDTAPPTLNSILNSENSFMGPGRDFRPAVPGGPAGGVAAAPGPGAPPQVDKQTVVTNSHLGERERPDPQSKDAANAHHPDLAAGLAPGPGLSSGLPLAKEGLVVMQEQHAAPRDNLPEDLSVKRPRDGPPGPATLGVAAPYPSRNPSPAGAGLQHPLHVAGPHVGLGTHGAHVKPGTTTVYRTGPGGEGTYYHGVGAQPHGQPATPHLVMGPRTVAPPQQQHQPLHNAHLKQPLKVVPPASVPLPQQTKLSPKLVTTGGPHHGHGPHAGAMGAHGPHAGAHKAGSITHGTPVSSPQRYNEGLLRPLPPHAAHAAHPHQPVGKEGGSITQGTPVHLPARLPTAGAPMYDYYKRPSPSGVTYQSVHQPVHPPVTTSAPSASGGFTSPYPHQGARPATSYTADAQLNSRHIIMTDYYTSQQMHGPRRPPDKPGQQGPPLWGPGGPSPRASPGPGASPHSASPHSASPHSSSPQPQPPPQASPQSVQAKGPATIYIQKYPPQPSGQPVQQQQQPQRLPPERTPPPQARQGVIQRHNTTPQPQPQQQHASHPPAHQPHQSHQPHQPSHQSHQPHQAIPTHPPHQSHQSHQSHQAHAVHQSHQPARALHFPPQGHEAFASLVDVAVAQPSLPVPVTSAGGDKRPVHQQQHHEGLGKTMADSLRERERDQRDQRTPPGPGPGPGHHPGAPPPQDSRQQQQQQILIHHQTHPQRHPPPMQYHQLQQQHHNQHQARLEQQRQMMMAEREKDREREASRVASLRHTPSPQMQMQLPPSSQAAQVSISQASSPAQRESSVVNRTTPLPQSGLSGGSSSSTGAPPAPGQAGAARPSSTSGDSTLTAASVIDAIITHTINEGVPSSNAGHPGPHTSRLGDRLFQGFHRDQSGPATNDAVFKASPMKGGPATSEAGSDSASTAPNSGPPPPASLGKKTLSENIDSIITKELNATPNSFPRNLPYNYQMGGQGVVAPGAQSVEEQCNWKLRRAMQQKEEMEAAREREREKGRSTPTQPGQGQSGQGQPNQGQPGQGQPGQGQPDERHIIRIMSSSPRKGTPGPPFATEPVSPPDSVAATSSTTTTTTTNSGAASHWPPTTGAPTPASVAAAMSAAAAAVSVPASVAAADPMAFLQRRFFPDRGPMSPLDYVKNRIVEVMRTSDDDKVDTRKEDGEAAAPGAAAGKTEGRSASGSPGEMVIDEGRSSEEKPPSAGPPAPGQQPQPQPQPPPPPHTQAHAASPYVTTSSTYAFPYSALSVPQAALTPQTGAAAGVGAAKPPGLGLLPPSVPKEPVAEPKPLLSAQYEALSDED